MYCIYHSFLSINRNFNGMCLHRNLSNLLFFFLIFFFYEFKIDSCYYMYIQCMHIL